MFESEQQGSEIDGFLYSVFEVLPGNDSAKRQHSGGSLADKQPLSYIV